MKLNAIKIGYATSIAFALVWAICSLSVVILPSFMMGMSGHMVHAEFSGMQWHLNWAGFIYGLLAWSVSAGLTAALIAYIYNKLV
jgi:hypothetical protein